MTRSFAAELLISHPDLPLTPTIRAVTSATVEVEAQPITAPGDEIGPTIFVTLKETAAEETRTFESALAGDHTVDDWQVVLEFTDCRTYKIRLSSAAKFTAPEITSLGVRILSIRSRPATEGWRLQLQAPDKERLGAYWQYCRDEDVRFSLEKLYSTGAQVRDERLLEARLTDRQREVARTATRMGYYDPDGASAGEVAAELGISASTLSTHLRRITAKLFRDAFGE